MMPGASPIIPGLQEAARRRRTCRELGLCQWRDPACLDCQSRHYVPPNPGDGAAAPIDPEADAGLGRALLRGLAWTLAVGCVLFTAGQALGYAWTRWLAP
jgi:hypothetical protein